MSDFQKQRDWLVQLAMAPGWWQYSREQAAKLEQNPDAAGAWVGLREAVRNELKAKGFMPSQHEQQAMW